MDIVFAFLLIFFLSPIFYRSRGGITTKARRALPQTRAKGKNRAGRAGAAPLAVEIFFCNPRADMIN